MIDDSSFKKLLKSKLSEIISENKTIFGDFSEDYSKDYLESIKEIKDSLDNRKSELNQEFANDFYFEKCQLELIILQELQMFLILDKDFGLKFSENSKRKFNPNLFIVTNLMHQMNNNLVSFYKLLSDGFSYQANLIFRNIIEQGSTIFAILLDDKFLKEFKKNGNIEDSKERLKHWRNHLNATKINIILKKGYSDIESLRIYKNIFFDFNQWLYQDSSEFVHSQFLPSLLSSYSSKKRDDEHLDSNLFGRIDSNVERVCLRAIPYFNIFFDNFIKILAARFDYKFGDSDKGEGIKLWLVHKLTDELGKEYITKNNYS